MGAYKYYVFNFFSELKSKFIDVKNKVLPYQLVMVGDCLMYVEGKITLMTLSEETIVFKVENGVIIIHGNELTLKELSSNTIAIYGKIAGWEKI